jgi:hypothetical protein
VFCTLASRTESWRYVTVLDKSLSFINTYKTKKWVELHKVKCISISYTKSFGLSAHNTTCHHLVLMLFVFPKLLRLKLVTSLVRPGLDELQTSNANESLEFGARVARFCLVQIEIHS